MAAATFLLAIAFMVSACHGKTELLTFTRGQAGDTDYLHYDYSRITIMVLIGGKDFTKDCVDFLHSKGVVSGFQ